jgi:DNA-directed RNA polymerase specialized sigma24 family protein
LVAGPTLEATGWLTAAEELAAFEGIRLGDERAFRAIAGPLDPTLHRLAALYVDTDARADAVVRRTWEVALRAHEMFRWQTPLATWVAGFTVTTGRTVPTRAATPEAPRRPRPATTGPSDWADLPWSARWEGVGTVLTAAIGALPLAEREVLHGIDVERWPARRVCDVFGLTEAAAARLLGAAEARLHEAIARHVGQAAHPHREAQVAALVRWLRERPGPQPALLEEPAVAVFRTWAAGRGRRWPQRVRRVRVTAPAAAPAGRRGGRASATASGPPRPR